MRRTRQLRMRRHARPGAITTRAASATPPSAMSAQYVCRAPRRRRRRAWSMSRPCQLQARRARRWSIRRTRQLRMRRHARPGAITTRAASATPPSAMSAQYVCRAPRRRRRRRAWSMSRPCQLRHAKNGAVTGLAAKRIAAVGAKSVSINLRHDRRRRRRHRAYKTASPRTRSPPRAVGGWTQTTTPT